MQTKLTLRIDSELIEGAKRVATERDTSLSKMVADYFDALVNAQTAENSEQLPPITKSLAGILSGYTGPVDREDYREYLERKHS